MKNKVLFSLIFMLIAAIISGCDEFPESNQTRQQNRNSNSNINIQITPVPQRTTVTNTSSTPEVYHGNP